MAGHTARAAGTTRHPAALASAHASAPARSTPPTIQMRSTLEDWTHDEGAAAGGDVNGFYDTLEGRRQEMRERKKRQKRQKRVEEGLEMPSWDDDYDPAQPSDYDFYRESDESLQESAEWQFTLEQRAAREFEASQPPREHLNFAPPPIQDSKSIGSEGSVYVSEPVLYGGGRAGEPGTSPYSSPSHDAIADYAEPAPAYSAHNSSNSTGPPSKSGFGRRAMELYGWKQGKGLGREGNEGLVKPLVAKASRERKGAGKIVDRNPQRENESRFGAMTSVVRLLVPCAGTKDNLAQEIGDECNSKVCTSYTRASMYLTRCKYGQVERCFIAGASADTSTGTASSAGAPNDLVGVIVKFRESICALRAVNELDGRPFGDRAAIQARFVNEDKYEQEDFWS